MGGKCASFLLKYAEINDTTVGCKKREPSLIPPLKYNNLVFELQATSYKPRASSFPLRASRFRLPSPVFYNESPKSSLNFAISFSGQSPLASRRPMKKRNKRGSSVH